MSVYVGGTGHGQDRDKAGAIQGKDRDKIREGGEGVVVKGGGGGGGEVREW